MTRTKEELKVVSEERRYGKKTLSEIWKKQMEKNYERKKTTRKIEEE